jgi:hypothetical protein
MSGVLNFIVCAFSLRLLKEATNSMPPFTDVVEEKLEYFVTEMVHFSYNYH